MCDFDVAKQAQRLDHIANELLGGRCARGKPDRVLAGNPGGIQLAAVSDQIAWNAFFESDFAKAIRIRTVFRADHQDHFCDLAQFTYRRLPVLRRVADIGCIRAYNVPEPPFECGDHATRVVNAERGLRDIGDGRIVRKVERLHVGFGRDEMDRSANLTHRSLDLGMARVADKDKRAAFRHITLALSMHLGDQRTCCIEDRKFAARRFADDCLGNAMRAENGHGAVRHLVEFLDETGALTLQRINDVTVMHDFVAHIDRLTIFFERMLHDVDRPDDSSAKAPRLCKNDTHHVTP